MPIQMNQDQVLNLLKHIDAAQDEPVKRSVFTQLGHECFRCHHLDQWVAGFKGDVQAFLDQINVDHQSTYWESLVFSADKSQLILTGKEVEECACAFANCSDPPQSLCSYCCKSFQEDIFTSLLGKPVEVRITEAFLRGGRRCSTVIEIK